MDAKMLNPLALLVFPLVSLLFVLRGCPTDERFTVIIQRESSTQEEAALIVAAEHACPVREDVLAAAAPEERESLEAEAGDKCLWWYQDSSFKVPYAITSDAIDYLAQQIEEERQSTSMLLLILSLVIGSQLNYQATIEFRNRFTSGTKQFDDVYLVHMVLSYDRGLTGFQKERTVVVRADGEVLAVFGDGVTGWLHV